MSVVDAELKLTGAPDAIAVNDVAAATPDPFEDDAAAAREAALTAVEALECGLTQPFAAPAAAAAVALPEFAAAPSKALLGGGAEFDGTEAAAASGGDSWSTRLSYRKKMLKNIKKTKQKQKSEISSTARFRF